MLSGRLAAGPGSDTGPGSDRDTRADAHAGRSAGQNPLVTSPGPGLAMVGAGQAWVKKSCSSIVPWSAIDRTANDDGFWIP